MSWDLFINGLAAGMAVAVPVVGWLMRVEHRLTRMETLVAHQQTHGGNVIPFRARR